jgi:VWFA-related protein
VLALFIPFPLHWQGTHPFRAPPASYDAMRTGGDYTLKKKSSRPQSSFLLAALLLWGPAYAPAQRPPSPPDEQQPEQPIRVQVQLVNLFATVRDGNKRLVPDLAREELRVFEDGQEQKLEFFSREVALPITMGLLIDTSISQEYTLAAEQEAGARFFRRVLTQKDLAMVISFDVDVNLLADFTNSADRLERALERARINAPATRVNPGPLPPTLHSGGTNMYDAIYLACTEKLAREAGRKALLVVTDAYDTGSKVSRNEALEVCQRADTVLHFILISHPQYGSDPGTAKKFAEETGGRVMDASNEKKLMEAFDQIAEELRSQYILGYTPTNPTRDGSFRKIKVETTRRDTKVLTRKGYYAPKG